ncbi:hypothetical protein EDB85DRAFT_1891803 [Lactarius pseudohatsudake]|nr:hypothetical protein EDB85DRAFT_1891803 [Lactarius pseudohatsudake]
MPRRARRRTYPGGGEQLPLAAQNERDDFDDGAIPLWSLYETEVRAQDEVQFQVRVGGELVETGQDWFGQWALTLVSGNARAAACLHSQDYLPNVAAYNAQAAM